MITDAKAKSKSATIQFVSKARKGSHDRAAALLIGADDYIVKPFDPD